MLKVLNEAKANGSDYPSDRDMWNELGKMGYSEEERFEIAETVKAFLMHKNGNHSECRGRCDYYRNGKKEPPKIDKNDKPQYSAKDLEDMR